MLYLFMYYKALFLCVSLFIFFLCLATKKKNEPKKENAKSCRLLMGDFFEVNNFCVKGTPFV